MPESAPRDRMPRTLSRWGRLAVLLGLTGFAISQPVLAVLGDEPSFFVFRAVATPAIVTAAVAVALVPPLVLWGMVEGVHLLDRRAGRAAFLGAVALLVAVAVHQILRQAGLEAPILQVLAAGALGGAFTLALARFDGVARWARYTAVLPGLALASFLFLSPTSALISGTGTVTVEDRDADVPSVVLLVLDEFSTAALLDDDGGIDERRFPNLTRFARDATWYRNHTGIATGTQQALPSMLSGRLPRQAAPILAEHPENIFTLLAGTHHLEVSESLTALCAFDRCRGSLRPSPAWQAQVKDLARAMADVWTDRAGLGPPPEADLGDFTEVFDAEEDPAAPVVDTSALLAAPTRFEDFLDSIEPVDEPTFWYQHLLLPHRPWLRYPDGTEYRNNQEDGFDGWALPWTATVEQQRYLLQAQYTDQLIGRLLDRLQETDLYDDSLVVIVADHGVAFTPGEDSRLWSEETIPEVAFAPLFVKPPGSTSGETSDANVMGHDLLPTIADLLGLEVPWRTDGRPASSPAVHDRGTDKIIYDFGSLLAPTSGTAAHFDARDHQPRAEDRWLRPLTAAEDDLTALDDAAGVLELVGRRLDDLVTGQAGAVVLDDLGSVESPESTRPAFLFGEVLDTPADGGQVLIAEDGVVVAGAPLLDVDGTAWFEAFLPQEVMVRPTRTFRIAWRSPDGSTVQELTIQR